MLFTSVSFDFVFYDSCFLQLARETLSFWVKAFSEDTAKRLENFGFIQFRPGGIPYSQNVCAFMCCQGKFMILFIIWYLFYFDNKILYLEMIEQCAGF